MADRTIRIGPETFIGPPYKLCPACGAPEGLGLLMLGGNQAIMRCRSCLGEQRRALPEPPEPKVLYLDQWALSFLAKALHPDHRDKFVGDDPRTQRGAWPRLYARIERLVRLGLLVCPPSSIHRAETELDDRIAEGLRRVHLHLAGDAHLTHHLQVKSHQIYLAFCAWLDDSPVRPLGRDAVVKQPRRWPERLTIDVAFDVDPAAVEAFRASRAAATPEWQRIVDEWQTAGQRDFDVRFEEQLASFGPTLKIAPMGDTGILMRNALGERGVPYELRQAKIDAFLASDAIKEVPFGRLGCGLFAALGWVAGRQQPVRVDGGMREDFNTISVYAPYVDAMLVDRACARLLRETPLSDVLPERLDLFGIQDLEAFERWLDAVEAGAPDGHIELVRDVYGDDWIDRSYTTILS